MNNIYKIITLIFILISLILLSFNYFMADTKDDLKIVEKQANGVVFIQAIESLVTKSEAYTILHELNNSGYSVQVKNKINVAQQDLTQSLLAVNKLCKEYPVYSTKRLRQGIQTLNTLLTEKNKLDHQNFYRIDKALMDLRAEMFSVGDISTLHYEGEKDTSLFASIMTHYMPEFTGELSKARFLITHGLIEKHFSIETRNEIVHSISLFSLSEEEIGQIVEMLADEYDTGGLPLLLKKIETDGVNIEEIAKLITQEQNINYNPFAFYELTYELSRLTVEIGNENARLLSHTLSLRKDELKEKIYYSNLLTVLVSVIGLVALISFFISARLSFEREASIKNLLDQSQDAVDTFTLVSKVDNRGRITYTNDRFCKLCGYTQEELIGHSYEMIRHPDMPAVFFEKMWKQIENKQTWTGKIKNKNKNGETFYLDMLIKPILDEEDNIIEYISISSDITELEVIKNQLEDELKTSNTSLYEAYLNAREQQKLLEDQKELYELVFKNTASSVLIIDIESNKFIDCNEPAIDILGCDSKEDVLNLQPAQLSPEFQPDGRRSDEKSDEMNALAVEKGSHTFEWKHLRKDGKEIWVEVILTPILLGHKRVLHVVWKDIGDKIQAAKEREEQQMLIIQQSRLASMGEMIGNISHQWRQPLNALGLILQKLSLYQSRGILDDKKLNESVDKSMNLIHSMSSTIDDFRDFFNPNKEKSAFSVAAAIEKAHRIVESSFENSLIEYRLELEDDEIKIEGFENEFSQVMLNLLNNAKDALVENKIEAGSVRVKVSRDKDDINITVNDNAGGIPEHVLSKIFEPYFTTKEEGKGTGIGLYMSKMIVEDHMDGKLNVFNTDEGACFSIQFKSA